MKAIKQYIFSVLSALCLLILAMLLWPKGNPSSSSHQHHNPDSIGSNPEHLSKSASPAQPGAKITASDPALPGSYRATVDSTEPNVSISSSSAYSIIGHGAHAILKGKDGQTVWDAAKENRSLYSAISSPDGRLIVLGFEDGKYELYRVHPFEKMQMMPYVAPIERGCAFASWTWIDDKRLVGVNEVAQSKEKLIGLTGAEQEALPCERMLLYVYDIESNSLEQVKTDHLQFPPVFEVNQAVEGGHFQLSADVPGKGWQKIWITVTPK
jgi:hypothetical protein